MPEIMIERDESVRTQLAMKGVSGLEFIIVIILYIGY